MVGKEAEQRNDDSGLQVYMERIDRFWADLSKNDKRWCETAVDPC